MSEPLYSRLSEFKFMVGTHVDVIRQCGTHSWQPIDLSQREERIIHDYLIGRNGTGLKHLNDFIARVLSQHGFEVKFAGVFCHGHPRVKSFVGTTGRTPRVSHGSPCELGDLHLVFVFLDQRKNICYLRSILFQAKMAVSRTGSSQISHADQAFLYERAGSFDYTSVLTGSRNWPGPRKRQKALHYLFCGSNPIRTSSACAPAVIEFGELLFRFLIDSEGLEFHPYPTGHAGWRGINYDLLHRVSSLYYKGTARGEGISDVLSHFNDFADHDEIFLDLGEDSSGGISTMFVIVRDRELTLKNP